MEENDKHSRLNFRIIFFLSGGLLWAANQDWIELAGFFKTFANGWRDFLRFAWGTLFDRLRIPIEFTGYQKDALSLILAFLLSHISTKFFLHSRMPPLYHDSDESFVFSSLIYIFVPIFVTLPFVDYVEIMGDVQAPLFIFVLIIFIWISSLYAFSAHRIIVISRNNRIGFLKSLKRIKRQTEIIKFRGINRIILILYMFSIAYIIQLSIYFDTKNGTNITIFKYIKDYRINNLIDTIIGILLMFSMFIITKRSIRPLIYLLAFGFIVTAAGWVSGVIISYNQS